MAFREQMQRPDVQLRIGLVFLALASLSKWFLESRDALSHEWADGIIGLLYGISIGLMALGVWRRSHPDRSGE